MREYKIHGYYQTEDRFVWDTVKESLPILKEQIKEIYEKENTTSS